MYSELKALKKTDKIKLAEKHLGKYICELQRHFEFSDFQLITLLEYSMQKIRKNRQENFLNKISKILNIKKLI